MSRAWNAAMTISPVSVTGPANAPARVALLGLGTVGSALLQRLQQWQDGPLASRLQLVYAANSRLCLQARPSQVLTDADALVRGGLEHAAAALPQLHPAPLASEQPLAAVAAALGEAGTRIVIDATASQAVADRHVQWLRQGIHVVTASKLAQGTSLAGWRAIRDACASAGSGYGDSATVGAGLPLLRSIRDLRAGGDAIHVVAGVLSGSLAWLFNQYDGMRPFSAFVRQARDAGYTEPDPRVDLSGEDVRRKLLILARNAGFALAEHDVQVQSLLPPGLAEAPPAQLDAALSLLDEPLRQRFAEARSCGKVLRFIGSLDEGGARVGLQALAPDHPLAVGSGTDNRVAIWSDRYRQQPLSIQGPGAGAEVTAAGLLDDALRLAACSTSRSGVLPALASPQARSVA